MQFHLAVEDIEPGHEVAWVLDLPGCFSSARTQEQAVAGAPAQIAAHFKWLAGHGRPSPQAGQACETRVVEVFRSFSSPEDPSYIVNAFFEDDRRALRAADVEQGLWLLECTRRDLMRVLARFTLDQLARPVTGNAKDTLPGILHHLAHAEWWYCDRLGLATPPDFREWPGDLLDKLERVRRETRAGLPKLIGDDRIVIRTGERWSGRKVLRRALWHERDHTQQIASTRREDS